MSADVSRERRTLKRRNLSYYLPVINENTQQIFGHLVDISMKGMMVDCQNSITLQQDFRLRVDLTESIANKSFVSFVARSKWCRTDPIQPYVFNVGLEIVNITPGDTEVLRVISERYGASEK